MPTLHELPTPALVLDRARLDANIQRMADQLARFPHVRFRPHLKTSKCIEIAHLVAGRGGAVTVSTLREAEVFAAAGFADILYAVGISPDKLPRVVALLRGNTALTVIVDSVAAAAAVADHAEVHALRIPTLIEIDTDGHRGGLRPDDPRIAAIGARLGRHLDGVLTHAGESYFAAGHDEIRAYARLERDGITAAAAQLRAAGLPCPVVSVGSTPTALFTDALSGVTEMRAGVYAFQDLVMAGIGVCTPEQIALSVLTTVIGQQPGRLLVDAGWMAMSRDRGTQRQAVDMAYGLVCDVSGMPLADLLLSGANQEHGIVSGRAGGPIDPARFPIGSRLRILPNHACATAAQHPAYHVLEEGRVTAHWPRFAHW